MRVRFLPTQPSPSRRWRESLALVDSGRRLRTPRIGVGDKGTSGEALRGRIAVDVPNQGNGSRRGGSPAVGQSTEIGGELSLAVSETGIEMHTPGPWTAEKGQTNAPEITHGVWGDVYEGKDGDGFSIATVWADVEELQAVAEANARLIAAAPDLLEALDALLGCGRKDLSNPKYDGYFEAARAAIAKAEGR